MPRMMFLFVVWSVVMSGVIVSMIVRVRASPRSMPMVMIVSMAVPRPMAMLLSVFVLVIVVMSVRRTLRGISRRSDFDRLLAERFWCGQGGTGEAKCTRRKGHGCEAEPHIEML
jgi:hypothetical protein